MRTTLLTTVSLPSLGLTTRPHQAHRQVSHNAAGETSSRLHESISNHGTLSLRVLAHLASSLGIPDNSANSHLGLITSSYRDLTQSSTTNFPLLVLETA